MAGPNLEQKSRILICSDNDVFVHEIFDYVNKICAGRKNSFFNSTRLLLDTSAMSIECLKSKDDENTKLFDPGFEITRVRTKDKLKKLIEENRPPYYSAILYDSSMIEEKKKKVWKEHFVMDGKNKARVREKHYAECNVDIITSIRNRDFFLPQVVIGQVAIQTAAAAARAGALYFADDSAELLNIEENDTADKAPRHEYEYRQLKTVLSNIFSEPVDMPGLVVTKIGGSSFDYERQVREGKNLETMCRIFLKMHEEKESGLLLTVGAGQYGDVTKEICRKYADNANFEKAFPELIAKNLQMNLELLRQHFGKKATVALFNTGVNYYVREKETQNKVPLMGMAPQWILARDNIPLQDSDTHTIALAEFFGAERVVLVKRTDGIYDFDPYRGFELDLAEGKCKNIDAWRELQRSNNRYGVVSVDDMLSGNFSREGTDISGKADGSQGHLMEDSALEYFKYCDKVREICVVHIAPEEMYYSVGGNSYRHAITGETLTLGETGWKGVLEQRIRDAVKEGKCFSKIVR